jgi:hypothetical protein
MEIVKRVRSACLVMVKTDLAFILLKNDFDGPAHPADMHKLDQRSFGRSVAEVEFDLRGIVQVASDDQPDFRTRQIINELIFFGAEQVGKVYTPDQDIYQGYT